MDIEIIEQPFKMELYGCSGSNLDSNPHSLAFFIADEAIAALKKKSLKVKEPEIWVFDGARIFSGFELEVVPKGKTGIETLSIHIDTYAFFKYKGPFGQIHEIKNKMETWLMDKGYETTSLYIEIRRHWPYHDIDLETELIMSLK